MVQDFDLHHIYSFTICIYWYMISIYIYIIYRYPYTCNIYYIILKSSKTIELFEYNLQFPLYEVQNLYQILSLIKLGSSSSNLTSDDHGIGNLWVHIVTFLFFICKWMLQNVEGLTEIQYHGISIEIWFRL